MKLSTWASPLLLANTVLGVNVNWRHLNKRASESSDETLPEVPSYNFTIPVDHFDTSNKDTYDNRFFVNDTYYKSGGPVILFDFGEGGISPASAADFLAEFSVTSAPLRLAEKLNGLVIGWEHRYYGYSRPVPIDDDSGLPVEGASGYKYLTADQALEDVAYFANGFNKTTLDMNDVVQSTEKLDPYHTPWIFIGGSYPGMRAAWARLMHPEVWYAAWSSSAPVETQADGSVYYNPIVRALPQNCTNDLKAAIKFVDDTLDSGSDDELRLVYGGTYLATDETASFDSVDAGYLSTPFEVGQNLTYALAFDSFYQSFGPIHTTQHFCDWMERFDVNSFISDSNEVTTIEDTFPILFDNSGKNKPSKNGIAAANGKDGGLLAFVAMLYGIVNGRAEFYKWSETLPSSGGGTFTEAVDGLSWSWQTLNEMGYYQGSNASNPIQVLSKYYNVTAFREISVEDGTFPSFTDSSFPSKLNNSYLLEMGGWNMKASNVMFTNGQFDPWRSFSVASQESASGAPNRTLTTKVPACNELSDGTDVFGLVYAGAIHVEDLSTPAFTRGSIEKTTPLEQGLDLFEKAWTTWSACFNQSRDDIRNGKGVDGKGNSADGESISKDGDNSDDDDNSATRSNGLSVLSILVVGMSAMFAFA
ncbi:serine carboxypeptidase S28-domain-containing protein [Thelonectria olida]|uniref:Serine carboxypeptidase S28-domain-containing protein n=1 Tax=Thelonectria olida TaxID=1576542 RepID=A0A9P8VPD8_9HYPO|nr:serine carboxypeptidase S28-domain-containing protein [Thelonectria olida]